MRQIAKESTAWFALARLFFEHRFGRGEYRYLCYAIEYALPAFRPTSRVRTKMLKRIALDIPPLGFAPIPPAYGPTGGRSRVEQHARVLACLMFGWEARSEGR